MAISKEDLISYTKLPITSSDNLRKVIKEYNLIISTSGYTIDTSNFNLADNHPTDIGNMGGTTVHNTQPNGSITLAYNNKGSIKINQSSITNKDYIVVIPVRTITSIKVKSKRYFLNNQEEIKLKI